MWVDGAKYLTREDVEDDGGAVRVHRNHLFHGDGLLGKALITHTQ
jgi:hypothetical protein